MNVTQCPGRIDITHSDEAADADNVAIYSVLVSPIRSTDETSILGLLAS
jgi:hypothetical protein